MSGASVAMEGAYRRAGGEDAMAWVPAGSSPAWVPIQFVG